MLIKHLLVDIKDGVSTAKRELGGSAGGIFIELRDFLFPEHKCCYRWGNISLSHVREQTGGCPSIKDFSFESSENVVTIEAALNRT